MTHTQHAMKRSQQRGIPPLIDQWLDLYGAELHDGHGGVVLIFSRKSKRAIERDHGREPVRRLWEFFNAYKVVSSRDGHTITIGRRFRSMKRP